MSFSPGYHNVNNLNILKLTGADAPSFLQGQLSNDINALSSTWQYSGYCNPKGRLLALFHIWRESDAIYVTLDSSLVETVTKRLKMYIMRSNVVIEEVTTATCFTEIKTNSSPERFHLAIKDSVHTLCFGERELHVDLSGSITGNDSHAWSQACIAAGEPNIDSDNVELFVPQMVNLDILDGINFKKGCYTGQEIVARMHYLGKLKQRMFVCDIKGLAKSGDKISAGERNAGHIVSVSGKIALAVIRRELLESDLTSESGCGVIPQTHQPYSIPE